MSTLSITVSGPSASLAMLRALALKALGHAQQIWHTIKLSLTAASATARAVSNLALAALGSRTGYEIVLGGIRKITSSAWSGVRWCFSRSSRLLGHVARAGYSLIGKVSTSAAKAVEDTVEHYVVEPVLTAALTVDSWVCAAGRAVWELAHTSLVRTATTASAQVAGAALAVHVLSKGLLAVKIASLLPASVGVIAAVTNPVIAVGAVGAVFVAAAVIALLRVAATGPSPQPDGQAEGAQEAAVSPLRPYDDMFEADVLAGVDLDAVAAALRVEVTPDGSVIVHGIPADLPEAAANKLAQVAADAAVARLVKLTRQPNRDDRRVLTKVARQAVRKAA